MEPFDDIAIPIAWPEKTAYGDESWMAFLKKCGIVKNLNFKVGHAAILLVEKKSGYVRYFDFGRYIAPRGYGRARSKDFDPRLEMNTRAVFGSTFEIVNLKEILEELTGKQKATHGGGRLLFVVCQRISFKKAMTYAASLVEKGPILYGALAANNNSCSRYVAQILASGMRASDKRIRRIFYPECLKASPTSNVVNASDDGNIGCYQDGKLSWFRMARRASLRFQWSLITENLYSKKAQLLGRDDCPGFITEPKRPSFLPAEAQWLGGIGEGVWLLLIEQTEAYCVVCYGADGQIIYSMQTICTDNFDIKLPYSFTMQFSGNFFVIRQREKNYTFKKVSQNKINNNNKTILAQHN
ncbi:DUF6695 family protein [Olivibacter sp. XZL3]|uniref:DUF6695 family protein n=1 Tax=Olivibacter sp. XZL3 TaxID=1735116 RepID=UPI00106546DA|nr:DUF6695 family protein [Olivibacter sp. XZL3]